MEKLLKAIRFSIRTTIFEKKDTLNADEDVGNREPLYFAMRNKTYSSHHRCKDEHYF